MQIRNWSTNSSRIFGMVYGDPEYEDGYFICTSPVVLINNNIVTTILGHKYELIDSYTHLLQDIEIMSRSKITIEEYQKFTPTTFIVRDRNALPYLFTGLVAEAGEVAGVYAKYLRDDYSGEELAEKVEKELGDVLYFVFQLATQMGMDVGNILARNRAKLEDRRKRNVLQGNGDNR